MDSHFLAWNEPIVQTAISARKDDNFLSWHKPTSVTGEQVSDGDGVSENRKRTGVTVAYPKKKLTDEIPVHEILGSRVTLGFDTELSWRNHVDTNNVTWLVDHAFLDQLLFPSGGYISMVVEAANEISIKRSLSYTLREVSITSALLLKPGSKVQLQTKLKPSENAAEERNWYEFQIASSRDGSNWIERCVGRIALSGGESLDSKLASNLECPLVRSVSREYWYDITRNSGLQYGSEFRNLDEITTSVTNLRAFASCSTFKHAAKYTIHPVTIEQGFQILMIAKCQGQGRKLRNPSILSYIETLVVDGASGSLKVEGQVTETRPNNFTGDISMTADGRPLLTMQGCKMSLIPSNRLKVERKVFSTTEWSAARLETTGGSAKKVTLLVPDGNPPLATAIKGLLQGNGIEYDSCSLEDDLPLDRNVISLLDIGEPYVYNFTEARFRNFTKKVTAFKGSIIWVTPSAHTKCKNPDTSMIIGLARTLRVELRKDITTVEVDDDDLNAAEGILQIYQSLRNRSKSKDIDPDYEYAIVDGVVKIPRLHWKTTEEELACYKDELTATVKEDETPTVSSRFRSDACYFLVGGLGGLGREISRWMVENGARNILYLSRSAKEDYYTTPFFNELRSQGCSISTFAGSVTNLEDVEAAVRQATKPIAGVMQMSAMMRDNFLSQMMFSDWHTCIQPKVKGTWNLHHALSGSSLDFFLLFSSICGITGQWGQANYNSANSFLDAFVRYRHGQGLAASAIDIGFMGGVGMATENAALVSNLKKNGYYFLSEPELIDALAISIKHSRPADKKSHFALGITTTRPITSASCRPAWKKDARMLEAHHFIPPQAPNSEEVENLLNRALRNVSN